MRWNKCLCPPGWTGVGCHTGTPAPQAPQTLMKSAPLHKQAVKGRFSQTIARQLNLRKKYSSAYQCDFLHSVYLISLTLWSPTALTEILWLHNVPLFGV